MLSNVKKHLFGSHTQSQSTTFQLSPVDIGQHIRIESFRLTVLSKIAQGGFGCIYLAEADDGTKYALKKVMIHNQETLNNTSNEVDFLRILGGHRNIVKLVASEIRPNSKFAEYLMVLEFCPGGHVIDIMNRRLKRHFDESEVLKIFSDVCLAIAAMHTQNPPIIHRDIKLENVLLSADKGTFKLCDFGSATSRYIVPGETCPIQEAEDEIQRMTTLQYRSPEMIDLYQRKPITEKSDIWALGCLLYKLCFFEDCFGESTLSIMNAKIQIPSEHSFSDDVISLIKRLLEVDPDQRIDIIDTCKTVFKLRKIQCPAIIMQHDSSRQASRQSSPTKTPKRQKSETPKKTAHSRKASSIDAFASTPPPPPKSSHRRTKSNPFSIAKDPFGSSNSTSTNLTNPFASEENLSSKSATPTPVRKGHVRQPSNPFEATAPPSTPKLSTPAFDPFGTCNDISQDQNDSGWAFSDTKEPTSTPSKALNQSLNNPFT